MTIAEIQTEERIKILKGLEKAYEKLLEFKKAKNSVLVVMRDNKIVRISAIVMGFFLNGRTLLGLQYLAGNQFVCMQ